MHSFKVRIAFSVELKAFNKNKTNLKLIFCDFFLYCLSVIPLLLNTNVYINIAPAPRSLLGGPGQAAARSPHGGCVRSDLRVWM